MTIRIVIGEADFEVGEEYTRLGRDGAGAIALFVGLARDFGQRGDVETLWLEHYPGMAEAELGRIADAALHRWELGGVSIVHRVGHIAVGERIVLVGTSSRHRREAFAACEYIMDYLKTSAPFWKKEIGSRGEHWVEAREDDHEARRRWRIRQE